MSPTPAAATDPRALVSLSGRTAVVAGSSGGIGSAVVAMFRAAGAEVLGLDEARPGAGDPDVFLECDLSRPEAVAAAAAEIARRCGSLDALVHCAGITRDAVLWKMPAEDWSRVLAVNLDSAFHLLKGLTPLLRRSDSASVVLVSSINGERGKFGQSNYAASKAGLNALAKTAARELGRFGVRVNAVAPGLVRTPMTRDLPEEVVETARAQTALGRVGRPEDVAGAALFLCSGLAAHVTGQVLRVDGGQLTA